MQEYYIPASGVNDPSTLKDLPGVANISERDGFLVVAVKDEDQLVSHCVDSSSRVEHNSLVVLLSGQVKHSAILINEKQIARECEAHGASLLYLAEQNLADYIAELHRAEIVLVLSDADRQWIRYTRPDARIFCLSEQSFAYAHDVGRKPYLLPSTPVGAGMNILDIARLADVIPHYTPKSQTPQVLTLPDDRDIPLANGELVINELESSGSVYPLQALLEQNPMSDTLIVSFHGGLEPRAQRLPHYEWRGTLQNDIDNKLFISDPTLWQSNELKNGWYFGSAEDDTILRIKNFVSFVAEKLKIKYIIFLGSSAGGVAAFQLGAHFSNSISLGYSLQRNMSRGPKIHTVGFYEHVLKGSNWDAAYTRFGSRLAVHDLFNGSTPYLGKAIWIQNTGDAEHMRDHYLPELEAHDKSASLGRQIIVKDRLEGYLTYWGEGHPIPPRSLFFAALEGAKKSLRTDAPFDIEWTANIKVPDKNYPVRLDIPTPILHNSDRYLKPLKRGAVHFSGRAPLGMAVAIQIGDRYYQATKVNPQGFWSLDISFAKAPAWQVQLKTYDYANRVVSEPLGLVLNVVDDISNGVEDAAPLETESRTLDELGVAFHSDSSSIGHGYLEEYEKAFESLDIDSCLMVLITVRNRELLKTLTTYLPHVDFLAIESQNDVSQDFNGQVGFVRPKYYSEDFFKNIAEQYHPSVVIDDGTHRWDHQMRAFENLFISLKPGGYYIIEDMHTSFGVFTSNYQGGETRSTYNQLLDYITQMVAGAQSSEPKNAFDYYFRESVNSVKFLKHAIIIEKSKNPARVYTVRSLKSLCSEPVTQDSGIYYRVPGKIVNGSNYINNSFSSLSGFEGEVSLGAVTSGIVKNAKVIGGGVVCTSNDELIAETMNCARNLTSYRGLYRIDSQRLWVGSKLESNHYVAAEPGKQHVLLQSVWDANYGHWLWDTLSRIDLVKKAQLEEKPLWVINKPKGAMRAVVYDTLKLAGIDSNDVIEHDQTVVQYESVFIPAALTVHPTMKSPESVEFLENLVENIPPGVHQKIYVTRNAYGRRSLTNEEDVWPILQKYGFVKIIPEKLSFAEQASLFKGASVVAGNLGAAFSSLAFSPKGVTVLALTTPTMVHDFFYDIVCHKKGVYYALQGEASKEANDLSSNFIIDPSKLEELLASI